MSFVQREMERLGSALRADPRRDDYDRLFVAQQALAWASDPECYASPMAVITGTLGGSADCSAQPRPSQS